MEHWLLNTSGGSVVCICLLACFGLLLYFLPGIIAFAGHHPRRYWLFGLNLLVAWTLIGWAVLLAWALMQYDTGTFDSEDPV